MTDVRLSPQQKNMLRFIVDGHRAEIARFTPAMLAVSLGTTARGAASTARSLAAKGLIQKQADAYAATGLGRLYYQRHLSGGQASEGKMKFTEEAVGRARRMIREGHSIASAASNIGMSERALRYRLNPRMRQAHNQRRRKATETRLCLTGNPDILTTEQQEG